MRPEATILVYEALRELRVRLVLQACAQSQVKALLRLYEGFTKALLRLYLGSLKARIAIAGIYTIAGKESREFPKDCLKVANLRVLSLDQCDLQEVHMCKALCSRIRRACPMHI